MITLAGILIPWIGTGLGAALVFLMRPPLRPGMQSTLNGAAAGVMVASSLFSLLLPAIEEAGPWLAAAGLLPGFLLLRAADGAAALLRWEKRRALSGTEKLLLAVTLHNLPEGMAVGVALAAWLHGGRQSAALTGALSLAVGIALQNVPEGALVSMPLHAAGIRRSRAFFFGLLSGTVEPVGAVMLLLFAGLFAPLLPLFLSFAAGAMLAAAVEELIPDAANARGKAGVWWFSAGFILMMLLDRLSG